MRERKIVLHSMGCVVTIDVEDDVVKGRIPGGSGSVLALSASRATKRNLSVVRTKLPKTSQSSRAHDNWASRPTICEGPSSDIFEILYSVEKTSFVW